jgi:formate hydrogenlyase transcriptional activator
MSTPAQARDVNVSKEHEHLQLLLEVNNALVAHREIEPLFQAVSSALGRVLAHDSSSLCLYDPAIRQIRVRAADFPGGKGLIHKGVVFKVAGSPAGAAFTARKPLIVNHLDEKQFPNDATRWLIAEGIRSVCIIPLSCGGRCPGVLCLGSRRPAAFRDDLISLLSEVAGQITIAVENALAFQEIQELKDKLTKEKNYLEDEIRAVYDYEEMVGQSRSWKRVLEQIETVAPTDATVLILGETGTGKELVARAIHDQSPRRERTLVKLNCSAVPTGLLESELFGHEKGAFTGAIAQQTGRFELAHRGTLLLDEIGDIPLELQPKLLRALQEQQFERLGNPHTITVDVRVIASTNRDLQELVGHRQFREDLFYRLNVFPIVVPPLRERRSDIPMLVRYFAQKYGEKIRRRIETIPLEVIDQLSRANWPGNIRELENVIERAVIVARDGVLRISPPEIQQEIMGNLVTLETTERDAILKTWRACRGVIGGKNGAAAKLGLKRTTLNSRIHKLGISRQDL